MKPQTIHSSQNQVASRAHWMQVRQVDNLRLRYLTWIAALALFLIAQTISVLHAGVHPFHEHTQLCDLVEKAADPRIDSANYTHSLPNFLHPAYRLSVYQFTPSLISYSAFQGRAPPLFSV